MTMENVIFNKINAVLRIVFSFMLDTVIPADVEIRHIEQLSPEEFVLRACEGCTPHKNGTKDDVISLFSYKNEIVRKALVEIKDRPNRKIASILGRLLYEGLISELPVRAFPYLVLPIPITRAKRRERGWNQCELILKGLVRADRGKSFDVRTDVLKKIRATEDQVGKSRAERFENVKHSFAVEYADAVRDRHVIIFDDILTTGATLADAHRAVTEAGAAHVICVSMAR